MSKEKEKNRQKLNNIRQDLAKQYKNKILTLEKNEQILTEKLDYSQEQIIKLQAENQTLKHALKQMQDKLSLSDEELVTLISSTEQTKKLTESLDNLFMIHKQLIHFYN